MFRRRLKSPAIIRLRHKTAAVFLLLATRSLFAVDPPGSGDDTAGRAYRTAGGLLDRGHHGLALEEFQKFLGTYPEHEKAALARYGLGVCHYRLGRCPDAIDTLAPLRARDDFEFAAEVLTIIGQCQLNAGNFTAAGEAFEQVATRFIQHPMADDAMAGAVEARYGADRVDDARSLAAEFASRFPDSPLLDRVEFFAASCEMARKEYAAAAERFGAIAGRAKDGPFADRATLYAAQCFEQGGNIAHATRQYGRVLERKDSAYAPDALLALAEIAERQNRLDESGKLVDRLLDKYSRSEQRTSALLLRGRVFLAQNKIDEAVKVFDPLSAMETLDRDVRCEAAYHAAKARLRQEANADAAQRFQQVIERFMGCPWEAEARYDLGVALSKANRLDEAFAAFSGVRKAFPDHELSADALHAMVGIEHRRQQFDESVRLGREFLDRYAQHKSAASTAFLIAESEFLAGHYTVSVDAFRTFLAQFPNDPRVADARSRLGTALYRTGKLDEAEPFLRDAKGGGASNSKTTQVALGDVYFQRGEWKLAEEALAKYLERGLDAPAGEDALLRLGLAQARQARFEEAIAGFDRLLSQFPQGAHRGQASFEKGQALVSLGRREEAEQTFRTVLEDPTAGRFHVPTLRHLAAIAMQHRAYSEASGLYQRVAEQCENAADQRAARYEQGVALMAAREFPAARAVFAPLSKDSTDPATRTACIAQLGVALARENRCADAVEAFRDIEGGWPAINDSALRAAAQYDQAWCLRELGRTEEAAQGFQRLAGGDGGVDMSAFALLDLANIEMSAKRWDSAVENLTKLLALQVKNPDSVSHEVLEHASYRLGTCELERGRLVEASKTLEDFLARFPESPLAASAEFFAGEAAFRARRWETAARHFSRVTEQFPSENTVDTAYLRLGETFASLQRWPESERAHGEYLARFGDREQWFTAQFGVGWSRENQTKYAEATEAYEKVVARHQGPTAARAQFQIGECLFAQRRFDDALRELLKVDILYAYPEWKAAALFEAGRCFEELKKPTEASAQFRQVAENHAGTRWAELAAKRLSELSAAAPGR